MIRHIYLKESNEFEKSIKRILYYKINFNKKNEWKYFLYVSND